MIKTVIIAIIAITIIILILVNRDRESENFDLTVDLQQKPHIGKFSDCHLIGTRLGFDNVRCKNLCNKLDSCVGISYRGPPNNECRLYNDTSRIEYNPGYLSWFNFANRKIY